MSDAAHRIVAIPSIPFDENTYVAHFDGSNECIVFDPGLEPEKIIAYLEKESLTPVAILCTHGHSDHIAGNSALKELWPDCPIVIGVGDAPKLTDPWQNLSGQFGIPMTSPPADKTLVEGDRYAGAGFDLAVREIPGHSSGHVVFIWQARQPAIVFGGDVLFRGSVGRTDFPDGDFKQLRSGIHTKLFTLPDDTIVLPGHGEPTTVGHEKRTNPFVGEGARL